MTASEAPGNAIPAREAVAPGAPLRVSRDGAVATLLLDRAQALNTLDLALMDALPQAIGALAADDTVRVVVIAGAGRHFMAGGDLRAFAALLAREQQGEPARFRERIAHLHTTIETIARMPQIVIAKAQGAVAGFGLSLLCACDLAVAAEGAYFAAAYRNIGLTPDGGLTYSLPRLVGVRKALEILLLPDRFDAAQALALGLVNRVVPADALDATVSDIAAALTQGPRDALARTKRLARTALAHSLSVQLDAEAASFATAAASPEFAEGLDAFFAKRAPDFG